MSDIKSGVAEENIIISEEFYASTTEPHRPKAFQQVINAERCVTLCLVRKLIINLEAQVQTCRYIAPKPVLFGFY
jgi:hypothetical protein